MNIERMQKKVSLPVAKTQQIAEIIANQTTENNIKLVVSKEGFRLEEEGSKKTKLTTVLMTAPETVFFSILQEFYHFIDEESCNQISKIIATKILNEKCIL